MSEWKIEKLRGKIKLQTGFPFKSSGYVTQGIKLLRGDNVVQGSLRWEEVKYWPASEISKYEGYQLEEGDVILAMDRPWIDAGLKYAVISTCDLPCLQVQRTARLRGTDKIDSTFLKYVIASPRFTKYVKSINTGSSVPHISGDQIRDFYLPLPPLNIQQSIADVLSPIDKKIELNNRINAELEAMAKLIYDYWFVQFDFPDANGKPYKSSGGKMAYNQELKREIPDGWEVKPISEKLSIGSGYAFSSENYQKFGRYKLVTIKNVQNAGLDTTNTDFIDELPDNIKPYCILNKQDTLISLTGNVGRLCIVNENNLLLNQRVGKFLCPPKWNWYFYCRECSPNDRKLIDRGNFTLGDLCNINVISQVQLS